MCSVLQGGVKRNVFGVAGWSKAECVRCCRLE